MAKRTEPTVQTTEEFEARLNHRAAQYCAAVTHGYLTGEKEPCVWENLLRETADNLAALVLYMRNKRKQADRDANNRN